MNCADPRRGPTHYARIGLGVSNELLKSMEGRKSSTPPGRFWKPLGDLARIELRLHQHRRNSGRDALAWIDGRGRCLVHVDAPIGQREHNIRESAANIHADARSTAHVRTPTV